MGTRYGLDHSELSSSVETLRGKLSELPGYEEYKDVLYSDAYLEHVLGKIRKNGKRKTLKSAFQQLKRGLEMFVEADPEEFAKEEIFKVYPKDQQPIFLHGWDYEGRVMYWMDNRFIDPAELHHNALSMKLFERYALTLVYMALKMSRPHFQYRSIAIGAVSAKNMFALRKLTNWTNEMITTAALDRTCLTHNLFLTSWEAVMTNIAFTLIPSLKPDDFIFGKKVFEATREACDIDALLPYSNLKSYQQPDEKLFPIQYNFDAEINTENLNVEIDLTDEDSASQIEKQSSTNPEVNALRAKLSELPGYEEFKDVLYTDAYLEHVLGKIRKNGKRKTLKSAFQQLKRGLEMFVEADPEEFAKEEIFKVYPKDQQPIFLHGWDYEGRVMYWQDNRFINPAELYHNALSMKLFERYTLTVIYMALKMSRPHFQYRSIAIGAISTKNMFALRKLSNWANEIITTAALDRACLTHNLFLTSWEAGMTNIAFTLIPSLKPDDFIFGKKVFEATREACDIDALLPYSNLKSYQQPDKRLFPDQSIEEIESVESNNDSEINVEQLAAAPKYDENDQNLVDQNLDVKQDPAPMKNYTNNDNILHKGPDRKKLTFTEEYCRKVVLKYKQICALVWICILLMVTLVIGGGFFSFKDQTFYDWAIVDAKSAEDYDAFENAVQRSDFQNDIVNFAIPSRSQIVPISSFSFIYEWADSSRNDDIFTVKNLQIFCRVSRLLTFSERFPLFCQTNTGADGLNTTCDESVTDVTTYFYSSPKEQEECPLLSTENVTARRSDLATASINILGTPFFFDKSLENKNFSNASPRTRSSIVFGGPLGKDSTNGKDSFSRLAEFTTGAELDQLNYYTDFSLEIEQKFQDFFGIKNEIFRSGYADGAVEIGEIKVRYYSYLLYVEELERLLYADLALAAGSFIFIFICIFVYVGSFSIAAVGVTSVLMSVPVALFVYRLIFQIDYFQNLHVVTLFVILGIGADNVFVFSDAWKQSEHLWYSCQGLSKAGDAGDLNVFKTGNKASEVLIHRLSYTVKRASSSVFNTSLTTFAAFLATAASPLPIISAFGVFAAITVFINFLFLFLVFPSITIWRHYGFNRHSKRKSKDENQSASDDTDDTYEEAAVKDETNRVASSSRFSLVVLFTKLYIPMMLTKFNIGGRKIKMIPILTIIVNAILFVVFGINSLSLEVPRKIPSSLSDQHMFGAEFLNDYNDLFAGGGLTDFLDPILVFGIKSIDRDGFNSFDPSFRGKAIFDNQFELAPSVNQQHYLNVCNGLRALSCVDPDSNVRVKGCTDPAGSLTFASSVNCFLEKFYNWFNETQSTTVNPQLLGDTDPDQFYRALENFSYTGDFSRSFGFINSELMYITIPFTTTVLKGQPSGIKIPVFDLLYKFEDDQRKVAPTGLKSTFYYSYDMVFLATELGLLEGLFIGLSIALPASFLVLMYGTNNIYLAVFAIISISGIIAIIIGAIVFMGWEFGFAESVASIMVVGLSVDYCIHLGHMFIVAGEEGFNGREDRFVIAAERMGPTILAGFITTAGSTAFMFFCQLPFFSKYIALLIFLIVLSSLQVALGFFLPLLLIIGPENESGIIYGRKSKLIFCKLYYQKQDAKKIEKENRNKPLSFDVNDTL